MTPIGFSSTKATMHQPALSTGGIMFRNPICAPVLLLTALALTTGCGGDTSKPHGSEDAAKAHAAPDPGVDTSLGEDPPFEWMGVYMLPAGTIDLVFQPGPDGSMDIALVPVAAITKEGLDAAVRLAKDAASKDAVPTAPGGQLTPGDTCFQLKVDGTGEMRFPVQVKEAGRYALFTQHFADEFQTLFIAQAGRPGVEAQRIFKSRFGQIPIPAKARETFGITVGQTGRQALTPSFTAPARVAYNAEAMAQIGSAIFGRVAEITVRSGGVVKPGDVLLVIDSPELGAAQSDYLQKRTGLEIAGPGLELATVAYDQARALYDLNQGIALIEVQKRQAEQQTARAAQMTARVGLIAAENTLHLLGMDKQAIEALATSGTITPRYTIRAPIAGQVIRHDVTLGELVSPTKEALLVLADTTTVWVLVDVPEARLADVSVGSSAVITVASMPDETFSGTVSYVAPELDAAARIAQVRIAVANPAGRLKPGMFAQAEIRQVAPGTSVLSVPDAAVQTIDGKPVVFVPMADKPDTFLKRPVTLEAAVGDWWPVRYGLKEDEPIVLTSTFILKAELGKSGAKHEH